MIPKRRKRPKMMAPKEDAPISCQGHGKWIRGLDCAVLGNLVVNPLGTHSGFHECQGRMEAHHVKTRGAGGGDEQLIPLCALAHDQHHRGYIFVGSDFQTLAAELWRVSPHGKKYRLEHSEPDTGLPQPKTTPPGPPPSEHPNSARQSGRANSGE